jgi:GNAT superfamily N-acetyltransferase
MRIRVAHQTEAARLTEIVMAAKAHWGYSAEQLERWQPELTITAEQVATQGVYVAEADGIVGFYSLDVRGDVCELDDLWVVPDRIGRGVGRALLAHAVAVAASLGAQQLLIDADPNAEEFYLKCGAVTSGTIAAPIEGQPDRVRPQFVLSIR